MKSTEGRRPHAGKAEEALTRYMYAQIEQVFQGDVGLRRGQDPIHDTRVAIRRLRSTLRVFGKLLDGCAIDHPDLSQHPEGVEGRPVLRHLAILEAEYLDPGRGHALACWGHPHHRAPVRAAYAETYRHLIPFSD